MVRRLDYVVREINRLWETAKQYFSSGRAGDEVITEDQVQ